MIPSAKSIQSHVPYFDFLNFDICFIYNNSKNDVTFILLSVPFLSQIQVVHRFYSRKIIQGATAQICEKSLH